MNRSKLPLRPKWLPSWMWPTGTCHWSDSLLIHKVNYSEIENFEIPKWISLTKSTKLISSKNLTWLTTCHKIFNSPFRIYVFNSKKIDKIDKIYIHMYFLKLTDNLTNIDNLTKIDVTNLVDEIDKNRKISMKWTKIKNIDEMDKNKKKYRWNRWNRKISKNIDEIDKNRKISMKSTKIEKYWWNRQKSKNVDKMDKNHSV